MPKNGKILICGKGFAFSPLDALPFAIRGAFREPFDTDFSDGDGPSLDAMANDLFSLMCDGVPAPAPKKPAGRLP